MTTISDFSHRVEPLLTEVSRTNPERGIGLRSAADAVEPSGLSSLFMWVIGMSLFASCKEEKPFLAMNPQDIVQDPILLHTLLHTAHELSLVSPFLKLEINAGLERKMNAGPELSSAMTLSEKAETVRKHLREKGASYTHLWCESSGMLCFPREFCSLQNLQLLSLSDNHLTVIPAEIGQLLQLHTIDLHNNLLATIPAEIGQLLQLFCLNLHNNLLATIPAEIGQIKRLYTLVLDNNKFTTLPVEIWSFTGKRIICLRGNPLKVVPKSTATIDIIVD